MSKERLKLIRASVVQLRRSLKALGAAITGLGFVASGEGHHERLARLWGVVARVRREAGGGILPAIRDRLRDPEGAARKAIGDAAFEQRRAEGHAMSVDEGVAYALSGDDLLP